ncbi:MAG: hypothetical protein ACHQUC_03100 [Chlamydiales bacterium]
MDPCVPFSVIKEGFKSARGNREQFLEATKQYNRALFNDHMETIKRNPGTVLETPRYAEYRVDYHSPAGGAKTIAMVRGVHHEIEDEARWEEIKMEPSDDKLSRMGQKRIDERLIQKLTHIYGSEKTDKLRGWYGNTNEN